MTRVSEDGAAKKASKASRGWLILLAPPYLGLCFPQIYVRTTPVLMGFPFFYWYQLAWVLLTAGLLGLYYLKTRPVPQPVPNPEA